MIHVGSTKTIFRHLLGWMLILALVAKSTVGAAIVLHRHGSFKAHWHIVGWLDPGQQTDLSSAFGHKGSGRALVNTNPVQSLAVVGVGLVYVSTSRNILINDDWHALQTAYALVLPSDVDSSHRTYDVSTRPARLDAVRHVDSILTTSHAFLI